jgi:hypothetical protein
MSVVVALRLTRKVHRQLQLTMAANLAFQQLQQMVESHL